jgi:hypothetical protein
MGEVRQAWSVLRVQLYAVYSHAVHHSFVSCWRAGAEKRDDHFRQYVGMLFCSAD